VTDRAELRQLYLRVERAELARRQWQSLLRSADVRLAGLRRDLRNVKARVSRAADAPRSILKERHS